MQPAPAVRRADEERGPRVRKEPRRLVDARRGVAMSCGEGLQIVACEVTGHHEILQELGARFWQPPVEEIALAVRLLPEASHEITHLDVVMSPACHSSSVRRTLAIASRVGVCVCVYIYL